MKKRLISVLMVLVMVFTTLAANPVVLAFDDYQELEFKGGIDKNTIVNYANADLIAAAKVATTDEEATLIFNELVSRQNANALAASSVISTYVTLNSFSKSLSNITVGYKVTALIPSGVNLNVGYEYPAVIRTAGKTAALNRNVVTYSQSFSGPFLQCGIKVRFYLSASSYSETEVISTYFNASIGTSTSYRTITDADVRSNQYATILAGVSLLVLTLNPVALSITIGTAYTVASSLSPTPALVRDQYYRFTVTNASNYKVTVRVTIWSSQETYNAGKSALYDASTTLSVPGF